MSDRRKALKKVTSGYNIIHRRQIAEPFPKPCLWCGSGVGTQGKQNVFLHK